MGILEKKAEAYDKGKEFNILAAQAEQKKQEIMKLNQEIVKLETPKE